jgi:hypothetical protein
MTMRKNPDDSYYAEINHECSWNGVSDDDSSVANKDDDCQIRGGEWFSSRSKTWVTFMLMMTTLLSASLAVAKLPIAE